MELPNISLFEYMEDFDNAELPYEERNENLKEAVRDYNEQYDTAHSVDKALYDYTTWRNKKYYYEDEE